MTKFLYILGAIVLMAFALVAYTSTVRYRLTVHVETPEGIKAGSGVIEVRTWIRRAWTAHLFGGSTKDVSVTGEAVPVDLGPRGVLFVLLNCKNKNNRPIDCGRDKLPVQVLRRSGEIKTLDEVDAERVVRSAKGPRAVAVEDMPFMVRFRDIVDPMTVEAVEPEDLAVSFGDGVKLKRVTVEIVDAPVTVGIEKKLAWLVGLSTSLSGKRIVSTNDLVDRLGARSFKRGT